jgi:hypothetical protein
MLPKQLLKTMRARYGNENEVCYYAIKGCTKYGVCINGTQAYIRKKEYE